MNNQKIAFFGLLCSTLLIVCACQNQRLWYLYLNSVVDIAPDRFQFEQDYTKLSVPIVASQPLDKVDHSTKFLIVIIHGGGLNATSAFETALKTTKALNLPEDRFLVIAPQIIEGVKLREKGLLFWDRKWRGGGFSLSTGLNADLPRVSSFEVVDRLIGHAVKLHPGIHRIAIMGHSAGGQFVMRYAAVNGGHEKLEQKGISVRYVVANPSSYLYLDQVRYQLNLNGGIQKVAQNKTAGCPAYDNYRYGLENLYGYAETMPKETIQTRLLQRSILFLLGAEDTERNWSLDKSCEGDLQGENRYQRGILYKYHLNQIAGDTLAARHIWLEIPEVGHDATEMLTHPAFIEKLVASDFQE